MKCFIALLLAVGFAISANASQYFTQEELDVHFERFKSDHNRHYGDKFQEQVRKNIFAVNLDFIYRHNLEAARGEHSYTVGVNKFADLTLDEYRVYFLNQKPSDRLAPMRGGLHVASVEGLPSSVDWVAKGKVTPVKNQGANGAAWAFASIASIESAHAIKSGSLVELSDQEVTDCCNPYTNPSANGTIFDSIFTCLFKVGGVDTAASYPDHSSQCAFNKQGVATQIIGYGDINPGSETSLQYSVYNAGPVSVAIDASQLSFMLYAGGVYDEPNCSSTSLDHAVAVVGYGVQGQASFWKVKNSWGANWGQDGYILMSRNKNNQCGIATSATYPILLTC